MSNRELQDYLSQGFEGRESFMKNVLDPIFRDVDFVNDWDVEMLNDESLHSIAERNGVLSVIKYGTYELPNNPVEVFDIKVSDRVVMRRNRVGIQQIVHRIISTYSSAFIIFHYEDTANWDWRFTFCQKDDNIVTENKRFTFLLGPGQSCRTAAINFQKLFDKNGAVVKQDLVDAFNVEALSREFFEKYKAFYSRFVDFMIDENNGMRGDFIDTEFDHAGLSDEKIKEREEKPIRDYIKRLLGRLVFLQFLQKKGWLGVPADKRWGEGDTNFLQNLYNNATDEQKANFLDEILEPLFSDALDKDRSKNNDIFDTGVEGFRDVKIPYLNGGLFTRDKYDEPDSVFDAKMFEELFEFFSEYNFTIDENDPDDAEVGIDPEMLGRIFENLLEDNKDKGAYYTPKEIVQYMCRESLIAYLQTDVDDESTREALRQFVCTHNAELLDGISKTADDVRILLTDVKICDPAIGSGAFPMGLLRELYQCRSAIEGYDQSISSRIKKEIIQQNIYGVDIEKGAVDIARLRFWLSLILDEETPHALPNLDFKIMQGNSLLEQYKGIDLENIANFNSGTGYQYSLSFDGESTAQALLKEHIHRYYRVDDRKEKKELLEKIEQEIKSLILVKASDNKEIINSINNLDFRNNSDFFLWHTYFKDAFDNGGFDIVIGNPPYGAKLKDAEKVLLKNKYKTAQTIRNVQKGSLDTYTLFIELAYNLLRKNAFMAYIVPISITSSDSLSGVHKLLIDNCKEIKISSYAVRPKPVFENAVVNTSILMFRKTMTHCESLLSTKMHRKGNGFDLQQLIDTLQFVDVKDFRKFGRIPKIGTKTEIDILSTLKRHHNVGNYLVGLNGKAIYYRFAGGRYFKVITNYTTNSSAERALILDKQYADAIGCILSSNLSFWYYQIYSDNLNWKDCEIISFPIPDLTEEQIHYLNKLYDKYLSNIEDNANIRTSSGKSAYHVSEFKEYKIVKSKTIIDKIDDYICPLYGLSKEECTFIKNYELEFRMSGND